MVTTQQNLNAVFEGKASPLLIVHHVQVDFYKPHATTAPNNEQTADRIFSLAKEFIKAELRVFITELNTDDSLEPMGTACYGGVDPRLKDLGLSSSTYYSAQVSNYPGHKIKEHDSIIITGFNTSLCILESIEAIREKFPAIPILVPQDAVANNFIGKAHNGLSHEDALIRMQALGCILTDTESVRESVKKLASAPAPV